MEAKRAGGRTLAGDAYEAIRQAIRSGSVKPGERLRFADLQALCGMSVTPVREALARLTAEGFTVLDDHRGYSVASLSLSELRDLTAARQLCEGEALRLSVEKGDADWEARVIAAHHLMARIPQAREDIPSAIREDWEERHAAFHAALISACGSPILLEICEKLFSRADRYRRLSVSVSAGARDPAAEHRRLMELALARDGQGAGAALREHYGRTAAALEGFLKE
ncbi:GntR family transcriptional regulator [Shinella fusca]|jgi:DNA-binding GntR family transcriptional regulator|uniref:DNA-binding GntR family transcriptional regulator n=1 Tax=Shinella fusca TaxID=544480 RepID=A0A7W7YZD2_9HYPH|nr:FCD domain-containing protein [Shinella fusca]MBB5045143.1 DNA-binding GntR family transcriptional regulator [Shinella fusca]